MICCFEWFSIIQKSKVQVHWDPIGKTHIVSRKNHGREAAISSLQYEAFEEILPLVYHFEVLT